MDQGYDEAGITLTCDFDWHQVEQDLDGDNSRLANSDAIDAICECQQRIWEWVYHAPCRDLDGFMCRAIIATWVFYSPMRAYSMTEIAGRFGKKKQSLGRWVVDFKIQFPEIVKHLAHLRNAQTAKTQ